MQSTISRSQKKRTPTEKRKLHLGNINAITNVHEPNRNFLFNVLYCN